MKNLKRNDIVLVTKTNDIARIVFATSVLDDPFYHVKGYDLREFKNNEITLLEDIFILDEAEEKGSDLIFLAETAEGEKINVYISKDSIANYFDVDYFVFNPDVEYQDAGQYIFNEWLEDNNKHDIQIETLTLSFS
jgi:hypothetical protein